MSQIGGPLTLAEETDESVPTAALSPAELRRLFAAAAVTGKMPSQFLHDSVMSAVDETLASQAAEARDDEPTTTDARIGELSAAIATMLDPLDEIAAFAGTTPVRIELNDEERRRFTEALIDPPDPNEHLKAALADYRAAVASMRLRRSTG